MNKIMKATTRDHPIVLRPYSFSHNPPQSDEKPPAESSFQKLSHFRKEDIVIRDDTRSAFYVDQEPTVTPFNTGKVASSIQGSPSKTNSDRKRKLNMTCARREDGSNLIRSEYIKTEGNAT